MRRFPDPRAGTAGAGQALVEFLIIASFVLIPLFLVVPLFGKYIDMRHATIQAARYEAWEYSVWYHEDCERNMFASISGADNECPMGGFEEADQPIKPRSVTARESRQRFFSRTDATLTPAAPGDALEGALPITAYDGSTGWQLASRNYSWTDHRGTPMYAGGVGGATSLVSSTDTPTLPVIGDVFDILIDVIATVFGAIGDLLGVLGSSVGFDAINTDGYAKSTVHMTTQNVPVYSTLGTMRGAAGAHASLATPLSFRASAGVLTDGWNAGGVEHTYNQAGGTVPTVLLKELLNLPGLNEVWLVIGLLAPELRECHPAIPSFLSPDFPNDKGSLWLGHIDIDAVHPDRLGDRSGSHQCDDAGRCDFVQDFERSDRDCIP